MVELERAGRAASTTDGIRLAIAAMGTRFELVLGGDDPTRLRTVGEAALEEIETSHRRFSRFAKDSLLSHINRSAAKAPVRLDRDTFDLFRDALSVHEASGGAFDITVAPTMAARGLPSASHLDDVRVPGGPRMGRPGMDAVVLDEATRTVAFARPDVSLDLGAIAKGHALDLAATLLRSHGVPWALLHGGTSSVVAVGGPPEDGWRIALAGFPDPAPVVTLEDASLSVSNPRGRLLTTDSGETRGHLVDAREGEWANGGRVAAVVGPSARLGDAWSTALAVLGHRPPDLADHWITFIH